MGAILDAGTITTLPVATAGSENGSVLPACTVERKKLSVQKGTHAFWPHRMQLCLLF